MQLNKFAGRSLNDLCQYYIFPWVISNYTSQTLNFHSLIYRDLSKPIGALNEEKFKKIQDRINSIKDQLQIPFYYYGTHYSTYPFVLYYLIRIEPFTTLSKELQGGQFDCANRLFHSIPTLWDNLINNVSDVKESIPQFYYFPQFLKNLNKQDFGQKQITKQKVSQVQLPPWAKTPQQFINQMRIALESGYVSQNLNHWIDLIFGKFQRNKQRKNIFYPCTYQNNLYDNQNCQLLEIKTQITYFGQTPSIFFQEVHPMKKMKLKGIQLFNENQYMSYSGYQINELQIVSLNLDVSKNKITFLIVQDNYLYLYTIILKQNSYQIQKKKVFFKYNNINQLSINKFSCNKDKIIAYSNKSISFINRFSGIIISQIKLIYPIINIYNDIIETNHLLYSITTYPQYLIQTYGQKVLYDNNFQNTVIIRGLYMNLFHYNNHIGLTKIPKKSLRVKLGLYYVGIIYEKNLLIYNLNGRYVKNFDIQNIHFLQFTNYENNIVFISKFNQIIKIKNFFQQKYTIKNLYRFPQSDKLFQFQAYQCKMHEIYICIFEKKISLFKQKQSATYHSIVNSLYDILKNDF